MPSVSRRGLVYLGLDVHRDSISAAILGANEESPVVERIFNDESSIRRLIARFPDPSRLRACYEAGPTGYELHRLLTSLRVPCQVIAPSLIPKAPGDRVKTDRRDSRRLARLHRAGELVAIAIPTPGEEAIRDLCRTGETWSRTAPAPATGCRSSFCATGRCSEKGRRGRWPTSGGCDP